MSLKKLDILCKVQTGLLNAINEISFMNFSLILNLEKNLGELKILDVLSLLRQRAMLTLGMRTLSKEMVIIMGC